MKTKEHIEALAQQCGATRYTNRHFIGEPAIAFGNDAWKMFCWEVAKPEANPDADRNAPWMGQAHALCADHDIPPGNICDRLEALRVRLARPVAVAVDWKQVGDLLEAVNSANGHMVGTSNWGAAVYRHMVRLAARKA